MDESNRNGLFASKANNHFTTASNTIGSMIAATTTTPLPAMTTLPTSISSEDLSQSNSEYTDANESMSAPTEFLAEVSETLVEIPIFLYSTMCK